MYLNRVIRRVVLTLVPAMLFTACGGGGGSTPTPSQPIAPNVVKLSVDAGPEGTGYNVNRLYTDVTVCDPGSTSQCQTINHVLVDTGSTGLRLLSSAITSVIKRNRIENTPGLALLNCAQFVDNTFVWGPVVTADVVMGGKTAPSVPVQIIADPAFEHLAGACSSGREMDSAAALGANGIIGLGLFKDDCGPGCATVTGNGFYYTCADVSCRAAAPARASIAQQLKNPVALFASDNNGVLIDLLAVNSSSVARLSGSLIFGVATQSNNQLNSAAVLTTDSAGYVTTLLSGQTLNTSFIDTGSNALYFDSASIPRCAAPAIEFYCPPSLANLAATIVGANGTSVPVSFSVENALTLFASFPNAVLPTLAGTIGDAKTFDWGLPFFYGRRVFIGIEGQPSAIGTGPYYAF